MTIDNFLAELKDVLAKPGYTPYMDEDKHLRIRSKEGDCFCPLTLVFFDRYNEFIGESRWDTVAYEIDMDRETALDIVTAADEENGRLRLHLVNAMFN